MELNYVKSLLRAIGFNPVDGEINKWGKQYKHDSSYIYIYI